MAGDVAMRDDTESRKRFSVRSGSGESSADQNHGGGPGRRASTRSSRASVRQSIRDVLVLERDVLEQDMRNAVPHSSRFPRAIVENSGFVTLTTLLTLYCLVGDDCRLTFTSKPSDLYFDLATSFSIVVFIIELVLSCIGKQDYFGGFFFWLDLISTVTLVMDVTVVAELFVSDEESVEGMKNSKTARVAARAARVVRVLRLVRILKLYKNWLDSKQKTKKKASELDDDDWDDEVDNTQGSDELVVESNLGKKLSDLTTRKCVILILVMMITYPQLRTDPEDLFPTSQVYAANAVHNTFVSMRQDGGSKWIYEEALLRQIYFHNWFAENPVGCGVKVECPLDYKLPLFWFGLSSTIQDLLPKLTRAAQLNESSVTAWEGEMEAMMNTGSPIILNHGLMPQTVRRRLSSSWDVECKAGNKIRRGVSLLSEAVPGRVTYVVNCPSDLRSVERTFRTAKVITKQEFESWYFAFYFDKRRLVAEESIKNLITTGFVCVILLGASMSFSRDANTLVINPVENMMLKVSMIRINPLIAAQIADDTFKHEEMEKSKCKKLAKDPFRRRIKCLRNCLMCTSGGETKKPMETAVLESTIIKLGTLLALGFGHAGVTIISTNMQGQDSAGVNAMVPGRSVDCITAVGRLGDFSTFTEVLQTKVMKFVNQVSEIVHGVVDAHFGAPSRTTGDTFLLVWTVKDEDDKYFVKKLADMSVLSCVLILAGVNRSPVLAAYRTHPGLQQRLRSNTSVSLTFGLHFGWAIEGAIGSEYKIDASYASPNVSITENVESATHLYWNKILLTEALHELMNISMRPFCRLIDRVKVKGSPKPMALFSADVCCLYLTTEDQMEWRWNVRQRFRARQLLETEKAAKVDDCFEASNVFLNDPTIVAMRKPYTVAFHQTFGMGYQNYSQGEWQASQRLLQRASTLLKFEDGPIEALLRYMRMHDFKAPTWWKGFHPLDDIPSRPVRGNSFSKGEGSNSGDLRSAWSKTDLRAAGRAGESCDLFEATKDILDEEPAGIRSRLR
eukprot:TRINITY_DN7046_c0_g1_i1.p1 TRINITY_DN7046_c0_g1~~TRINITY_DN7046_c0_g1_i1.p1  ORF type:complete len:1017 (-),score=181.97 TRINITY_DN7046_c0_g1_i1:109-3159(-)